MSRDHSTTAWTPDWLGETPGAVDERHAGPAHAAPDADDETRELIDLDSAEFGDDLIPALADDPAPAFVDGPIPALANDPVPALPDEAIPALADWKQNWKEPKLNNFRMNVQGELGPEQVPDITSSGILSSFRSK